VVKPFLAIIRRDLAIAFRTGGGGALGVAFFVIVATLVPFGVGPIPELLSRIAPGMLWVAALLACLLTLDRLFQADVEDGSMDVLALSPVPLELIVLAKCIAHWLTTGLPLLLAAPIMALTLQMPAVSYPAMIASLALGTPALSLIGAIGAGGRSVQAVSMGLDATATSSAPLLSTATRILPSASGLCRRAS